MAKTDGYIAKGTDVPPSDWKYSNTGGVNRGDFLNPTDPAYIRLTDGPVPGASILEDGTAQDGPTITFDAADALLAGAPEADGERPWIVWAGVSPMSLREGLIVWNKPIVLLNKSKIYADKVLSARRPQLGAVTTVGRLMVIALTDPIAIDASEPLTLTIEAGAVGFYRREAEEEDQCPPEEEEPAEGEIPADESTKDEEASPISDDLLFCNMCNPKAQCGVLRSRNNAVFAVNNQFELQLNCTHPFYMQEAKCCNGEKAALVWMVSMDLFAATLPLEVYSVRSLVTYNPDRVGALSYGDGVFPGTLVGPATQNDEMLAAPPCSNGVRVRIAGTAGPEVIVTAKWNNPETPGYVGMSVFYDHCDNRCETGTPGVSGDVVDCEVYEDIIKPVQRILPVAFFEPEKMYAYRQPDISWTTNLTLFSTCYTTSIFALTTTAYETNVIFPTWVGTGVISLPGFAEQKTIELDIFKTDVVAVVTTCYKEQFDVIGDFAYTGISYPTSVGYVEIQTSITEVFFPPTEVVLDVVEDATGLDVISSVHYIALQSFQLPTADRYNLEVDPASYTTDLKAHYMAQGSVYVVDVFTQAIEINIPQGDIKTVTALAGAVTEVEFPQIGSTGVNLITGIITDSINVLTYGSAVTQVDYKQHSVITDLQTNVVAAAGTDFFFYNNYDVVEVVVGTTPTDPIKVWGGVENGYYVSTIVQTVVNVLTSVQANVATITIAGGNIVTAISSTNIVVCDNAGNALTIPVITWIGTGAGAAAATVTAVTAITPYSGDVTCISAVEYGGFVQYDIPQFFLDTENVVYSLSGDYPPTVNITQVESLDGTQVSYANSVHLIDAKTNIPVFQNTAASEFQIPTVGAGDSVWAFQDAPVEVVFDTLTAIGATTITQVTSIAKQTANLVEANVHTNLSYVKDNIITAPVSQAINVVSSIEFEPSQIAVLTNISLNRSVVNFFSGLDFGSTSVIAELSFTAVDVLTYLKPESVELVTACERGDITMITGVVTTMITVATPTTGQQITFVTSVALTNIDLITFVPVEKLPVVTSCTYKVLEGPVALVENTDPADWGSYWSPDLDSGFVEVAVFPKSTTGDCDREWKFLMHPGQLEYTIVNTSTQDCCDGAPRACVVTEVTGHPSEEGCSSMILLGGMYFNKPASDSAEKCPCYDCNDEQPCANAVTDVEQPPDNDIRDPEPCTLRVRRVRRRWGSFPSFP